jgi:hypothetical protein
MLSMISGPDTEFFQWWPTSLARLSRKTFVSGDDGNGTWKRGRGWGYYKRRRMLFPAQRILTFQERSLGK